MELIMGVFFARGDDGLDDFRVGAVDAKGQIGGFLDDPGDPFQLFDFLTYERSGIDVDVVRSGLGLSFGFVSYGFLATFRDGLGDRFSRGVNPFCNDQHDMLLLLLVRANTSGPNVGQYPLFDETNTVMQKIKRVLPE